MALYERSAEALEDWRELVEYFLEHFGRNQTRKYTSDLLQCIKTMASRQGYFKEMQLNERRVRYKLCQNHYVFGLVRNDHPFLILAFFHERMDLMQRLKKRLRWTI